MNPAIAKKGSSFKGVFAYLLHDKGDEGKQQTKDGVYGDRVDWTYCHNLPTNDPEMAKRMMIDLACHADELKRANGWDGRGNKSQKPVYHYSLNWHEQDQVSEEQMIETALESLKRLKLLKDHQAVFFRHNDTDHAHVHVVVNLVHPETGKQQVMSRDAYALSRMAQQLNKEHGWLECEQRVENNALRDQGKHKEAKYKGVLRDDWLGDKTRGEAFWHNHHKNRENHSARQQQQTQALFEAKEQQITRAREIYRETYREKWAELFEQQREEFKYYRDFARSHHDLKAVQSELKAKVFEKGGYAGVFNATDMTQKDFKDIEEYHASQRSVLRGQEKAELGDHIKLINKSYRQDRTALSDLHRAENKDFDRDQYSSVKDYLALSEELEQDQDYGRERTRERDGPSGGSEPS